MYQSPHAASSRTLNMETADYAETLLPVYITRRGHDRSVPFEVTPDLDQTGHRLFCRMFLVTFPSPHQPDVSVLHRLDQEYSNCGQPGYVLWSGATSVNYLFVYIFIYLFIH